MTLTYFQNIIIMVINLNYKNILFDLDGTLTDPKTGITNSVAYALKHYGIEVSDKNSLCSFIGPPLIHSFNKYYGFDEKKALEAVNIYREYFSDKGIFENNLYDGVIPMLEKLQSQNKRLFIATSKPQKFACQIAAHFGFDKFFEAIRGIPMDGENMSKDQVIAKVMREFSLQTDDTIMVGDRSYDVDGARENGLACVGVLYGYGDRNELENAKASHIVNSVTELKKLLED